MPRAVISKKNSGGKFIVMKHNEKRVLVARPTTYAVRICECPRYIDCAFSEAHHDLRAIATSKKHFPDVP
jgi:hypothetical protein